MFVGTQSYDGEDQYGIMFNINNNIMSIEVGHFQNSVLIGFGIKTDQYYDSGLEISISEGNWNRFRMMKSGFTSNSFGITDKSPGFEFT